MCWCAIKKLLPHFFIWPLHIVFCLMMSKEIPVLESSHKGILTFPFLWGHLVDRGRMCRWVIFPPHGQCLDTVSLVTGGHLTHKNLPFIPRGALCEQLQEENYGVNWLSQVHLKTAVCVCACAHFTMMKSSPLEQQNNTLWNMWTFFDVWYSAAEAVVFGYAVTWPRETESSATVSAAVVHICCQTSTVNDAAQSDDFCRQ